MKPQTGKPQMLIFTSPQDVTLYNAFRKKCIANDRTIISVVRRLMSAYLEADDAPPTVTFGSASNQSKENER